MADNKQDGLNKIGSNATNPAQVLADKKAIIARIPFKDPRGQRSITISNGNGYDVYVCIMNNIQNSGQYANLTTTNPKPDAPPIPMQAENGNGIAYDTAHSAGIEGFRDAAVDHELGFVGISMDCGEDDFVDVFQSTYKYAYLSDSLDGPVSFPLATKINQAKSTNNQELQIRNVKFAGVLNRTNDLVFILKAGRTLTLTFDVAHIAKSTR
jgi:hypothetical protein